MIYINADTTQIKFPRHTLKSYSNVYTVMIKSKSSPKQTLLHNSTDISTEKLFYIFNVVDILNISAGEYEYIIINELGEEVENGLLTYGEYVRDEIISANIQPTNNIQFKRR